MDYDSSNAPWNEQESHECSECKGKGHICYNENGEEADEDDNTCIGVVFQKCTAPYCEDGIINQKEAQSDAWEYY